MLYLLLSLLFRLISFPSGCTKLEKSEKKCNNLNKTNIFCLNEIKMYCSFAINTKRFSPQQKKQGR